MKKSEFVAALVVELGHAAKVDNYRNTHDTIVHEPMDSWIFRSGPNDYIYDELPIPEHKKGQSGFDVVLGEKGKVAFNSLVDHLTNIIDFDSLGIEFDDELEEEEWHKSKSL